MIAKTNLENQMTMSFEEITADKHFITDLTSSQRVKDSKTKKIVQLARYAVWSPLEDEKKHAIVEVGNNLKELQKKYKVEDELVLIVH